MDCSSDEPVVQGAIDTLDELKVDYEVRVLKLTVTEG
jgi:phosphoribosylcarboxyaminoimidazole (NCAIR) mutase